MTTGEAAWLSAPQEQPEGGTAEVLKQVQDSALELLHGLGRAPKTLRIRADQVELRVEWPDQEPAARPAGAAATTAPASTGPTAAEPVSAVPAAADTTRFITAQTVGTFYRSPEPGAKPFVEPGDIIRPGQQVGIIEAMKLMIPVEADAAGRIVDVLVSNGAPVEFGDQLFCIDPASG
jgi:acetyl-CoA carboxylase biotin carboxyl carrier protein